MPIFKKFYNNSSLYTAGLKILGYERSLEDFVKNLNLNLPDSASVFEIGCGSGVLGRTLLKKHSDLNLLATDIEPGLLHKAEQFLSNNNICESRFRTGICDATNPRMITMKDGETLALSDSSFDLVVVGAVLGHTDDHEYTLREVLKLLKPNGYVLIVEMSGSITGKIVSRIHEYRNLNINALENFLEQKNCSVKKVELTHKNFPANLTRTALIVEKQ